MLNPNVVRLPKQVIKQTAKRCITPFFLYEERRIQHNCRLFKKSFGRYFKNFTPLYAVKANTNPRLLRIIIGQGFGLDCSSQAEAWIAKHLGGWGMYTGNYTTEEEFKFVLKQKNLLLNLDDISMIKTVAKHGMPKFISFRINPGIAKGGSKSLILAGPEAKYGVPWEQAKEAYQKARKAGARQFGIHAMTGSNVLDERYFAKVAKKLLEIAGQVKKELNIDFEYINIGGGFGVPYQPRERSLDLGKIARSLRQIFDEQCRELGIREPKLMVEPGRFIMADAGWLITRVHVIKKGYKKFVGVDAGMNDLPRPAIYGAYHHITVLSSQGSVQKERVNIVGRLCENNDQFAKNRYLPKIKVGDIIAIHNAGAHSFAMGHNYNNRLRSAEYLLWRNGTVRKIRRAETIKDLFRTVL
jgi:diaminopimelate decarboxylase